MYRVIVADDERHVVDWVTDLLTYHFPDLEIQQANNGIDALSLAEFGKVDMAMLDIKMPGINGIETAHRILKKYPACKVLLLTGYDEFDLIYQVNSEKNIRYALKTETDSEIIEKISAILAELEQEQRIRQTLDLANRKSRLIQHIEWRSMLSDVIFESESTQAMNDKLALYRPDLPLNPDRSVVLTLISFSDTATSHQSITNTLLLQLYQTLEDHLRTIFRFVLLDLDRECVLLLAQSENNLDESKGTALLRSELDRGLTKQFNSDDMQINFFVHKHLSDWHEISPQYNLLLQYSRSFLKRNNSAPIFGAIVDLEQEDYHPENTQYKASQII